MAYAYLKPVDIFGTGLRYYGFDPIMSAIAPTASETQSAGRKIKIIVNDQNILILNFVI